METARQHAFILSARRRVPTVSQRDRRTWRAVSISVRSEATVVEFPQPLFSGGSKQALRHPCRLQNSRSPCPGTSDGLSEYPDLFWQVLRWYVFPGAVSYVSSHARQRRALRREAAARASAEFLGNRECVRLGFFSSPAILAKAYLKKHRCLL